MTWHYKINQDLKQDTENPIVCRSSRKIPSNYHFQATMLHKNY